MPKHKESKSFGNPADQRGAYKPPSLTLEERVTNLEIQLKTILEIVRDLEQKRTSVSQNHETQIPDNIQIENIFKD